MKFAVLGAGAIGAYVGAALARGGADVTLIARGPHLEAMRARGVRVLSPRGDFAAWPDATDDLAAVAVADVVFVALKAYSLPAIAPRLGPLLAPGAAAIWAQNGIPWWYFQSHPPLPWENGAEGGGAAITGGPAGARGAVAAGDAGGDADVRKTAGGGGAGAMTSGAGAASAAVLREDAGGLTGAGGPAGGRGAVAAGDSGGDPELAVTGSAPGTGHQAGTIRAGLESVDPGGVLARSIRPEHNVGCVVYCSTEIVEPGLIRHIEGTRFTIGEPDGSASERCAQISAAFSAGGLKAPVEPRLRDQIWLKLIGNVAFNPITALTRATLGELGTIPEMRALLRAIFDECAAVADRLGIRFPVSLDRRLEAGLAVGDHRTSMLQDLQAGKRLELDCMTGAVSELAGRLGIDVPHVRTVHACVKLLDQLRSQADSPVAY